MLAKTSSTYERDLVPMDTDSTVILSDLIVQKNG